jgi:hypothetical protein
MLIRVNPRKATGCQPAEYSKERLRIELPRCARYHRYL